MESASELFTSQLETWRARDLRNAAAVRLVRIEDGSPVTLTVMFKQFELDCFADAFRPTDGKATFFIQLREGDDEEEQDSVSGELDDALCEVNMYLADHSVGLADMLTRLLQTYSAHCDKAQSAGSEDDNLFDNLVDEDSYAKAAKEMRYLDFLQARKLRTGALEILRRRFDSPDAFSDATQPTPSASSSSSPILAEAQEAAQRLVSNRTQRVSVTVGMGLVQLAADPLSGLGLDRDQAQQLGLLPDEPVTLALVISEAALAAGGWLQQPVGTSGGYGSQPSAPFGAPPPPRPVKMKADDLVKENFDDLQFAQGRHECYALSSLFIRLFTEFFQWHLTRNERKMPWEAPRDWILDAISGGLHGGDPNLFYDFWHNVLPTFLSRMVEYCPICLRRHSQTDADDDMSLTKLCPCSIDLCTFTFEECLMPLRAEILRDPGLAEFQVALAASAASSHHGTYFEPFPPQFLKTKEVRARTVAAFGQGYRPDGLHENKDCEKLLNVLKSIPRLSSLTELPSEKDLQQALQAAFRQNVGAVAGGGEVSCYRLVQFVLSTCRLQLKRITNKEHRLHGLHDNVRQFAVLHGSVAFECNFQERKKQFGSAFGFHGSPMDKWYSILRNGLQVLSGSSYMTSGAVYGKGIYLARDLRISAFYSGGMTGFLTPCEFGEAVQIFGVVEYIKNEAHHHTEGIITVNSASGVMLRYILVSGNTGPSAAMTPVGVDSLQVQDRFNLLQNEVLGDVANERNQRLADPLDLNFVDFRC
eukprot:TRINITY_DN30033_c0_g1_i2.p1 TRINITY_DN30033_c0_g1~~TRINITY_DN30033_c0_g1_i2.p1  ORF type:complete len:759 (+),score=161.97 TRINITY_DN30033_c0_g1_i2:91-2367(+)